MSRLPIRSSAPASADAPEVVKKTEKSHPAYHHLRERGFSHRSAKAIVDELGPDQVLKPSDPVTVADTQTAQKHVESFGYSAPSAAKIVKHVGAHVVLAHKALDTSDGKKAVSFWDAPLGEDED